MTVTHQIKIDLQAPGIAPAVNVVQLDSNTRVIKAALYSGNIPFTIDDNAAISLACIKPDRTQCWYDQLPDNTQAASVEGNVISVTLAPEVLTVAGTVKAAIVIRTNLSDQVSTFPFVIRVAHNPAAGSVISNHYYKIADLEAFNIWMKNVICCTPQEWTAEQQAQILQNIGAMAAGVQQDVRIATSGENAEVVILETETRESGSVVLQHHTPGADGPVILGSISPGEKDTDAATVGQVKEMVKQSGGGSLSAEIVDNVLVVTLSGGVTASIKDGVLVVA